MDEPQLTSHQIPKGDVFESTNNIFILFYTFLGIFSITSQIFFTFLNNTCILPFVYIILFSFILFGDFSCYELNNNTHIITMSAYYSYIGVYVFQLILFGDFLGFFGHNGSMSFPKK